MARAGARIVGSIETVVSLVRRVSPFVARLARAVLILALAALAAAAVIAVVVFRRTAPSAESGVVLALLVLLLLVAPATLLLFQWGLRRLLKLPQELRQIPERARTHAAKLGQVAGEARGRRGLIGTATSLWKLGRHVVSSRELLTVYAPALRVVTPWALAVAAIAGALCLVEIVAGVVVGVWAVLT